MVYGCMDKCIIENNFNIHSSEGLTIEGGNNTQIKYNNILMNGEIIMVYIYMDQIFQIFTEIQLPQIKMIIDSKSGNGIQIVGDSHPVVSSNLIYGFENGINADLIYMF